ncbi:elongation factor G [bacterium]|nr:elongation factor G [bacterium]
MKVYAADKIRNLGLVGHGGVGKTTFAEALIFTMGVTNRMGSIDDGNTLSDYHQDEVERKISINTSMLHGEWKDCKINILDMPGYSDFMGGAKGALRVADIAVAIVSAVDGVEVGTEQVLEFADEYKKPRVFYVNRMNNEHAKFDSVLANIKDRFGTGVVAIEFPANSGEGFNKIVDVLKKKLLVYEQGSKAKPKVEEIPDDLKGRLDTYYGQIIEAAAESDDALMEAYFESGELTEEQIVQGLRKGILNGTLMPVLCGAADINVGTTEFLDFITAYCPSPAEFAGIKGKLKDQAVERKPLQTEPTCAFVFQTVSEAHVGELSLVRVYSGSLSSGAEVMNSSKDNQEKIGQIYLMNGKNRNEIGQLVAGDIGALVKLRSTKTNDTLCDKRSPIVIDPVRFPEPVISVAVNPKSRGDEEKISTGLHVLQDEDPSFKVVQDPELHQTIVSGQGDLHLKVIINRLKDKYGVEVEEERPKIPYRETITAKADDKYRHKKQTGGAGQFAEVWMRIEPQARGEGFDFGNEVKGGNISSVFIPSIEKGVKQVLEKGPVAGYHVVDVKAIVYDGKEHPVDSKDIAFQTAGREVFKAAFLKARPILLEPIYDVEVKVPEDHMGDVMGDLSGRRGKIMGTEAKGTFQVIKAKVPLADLDRYATTLRSITSGRGLYRRTFSHYEQVPKDQEIKIIEESRQHREEEK